MNRPAILLVFLLSASVLHAQHFIWPAEQLQRDSIRLAQLPPLVLPHQQKSSYLPYSLDNSNSISFPALFTQYGSSCNQCSSIAYLFTYELNVLRRKSAAREDNRMSLLFPWNMLNSGTSRTGVSYFDSWALVDAAGCANEADFGYGVGRESADCTIWMTGYPKYYRAMQNRIEGIYSIDIGTPEGLLTLKRWLFDHGGDGSPGGVASFQIASGGIQSVLLPAGTEEAGKSMITRFAATVGHSMTFVGYNDSVRYDFNGDGRYTNDLDLNGDGKITMLDWEKGALIFVDSYLYNWGGTGKGYVAYRLLPNGHTNGGIWMRSAVVAKVHSSYKPKLAMKVRLSHPNRSRIRITAGVSQNSGATKPDHILHLPLFDMMGGSFPMQGTGTGDQNRIEVGIDVTPLLGFIEPGRSAAFFLVLTENDPDLALTGVLEQFSFMNYTAGAEEYLYSSYNINIQNGSSYYRVVFSPDHDPPAITTPSLPGALSGEPFEFQLEASGGTPPYTWLPLARTYREERFTDTFPSITETRILPVVGNDIKTNITLPFSFPLYGKSFTKATLYTDGYLMFEPNTLNYPYAIDPLKTLAMNRAIYPWYNTELSLPHMQDWIYYQALADRATIRWNASINSGGRLYDANFATRLYPDGTIEFYYGNIEIRPGYTWLVAVAGGSPEFLMYPDINMTGIFNGLNIRFIPEDYPEGITLSQEGILSGIPTKPGQSCTLTVWVEDYNKIRSSRTFQFTTGSLEAATEQLSGARMILYPNPTNGETHIRLQATTEGDARLTIFDSSGRCMLSRGLIIRPGENVISVPETAQFPQGIYLFRVTGAVQDFGRLVR